MVTGTLTGYTAGETVEVTVYSTPTKLANLTANQKGVVAFTLDTTNLAPGAHRLELVGATSGSKTVWEFQIAGEAVSASPTATAVQCDG